MTASRQQRRFADRSGTQRGAGPFFRRPTGIVFGVLALAAFSWYAWDRVSHLPSVREGAPSWSHDSRRIVFYSERLGKGDIFVMNADGTGTVDPITSTPKADEGSPAFSPDDQQIAYDSDKDGNFEIYVSDAKGENARRLTRGPSRDLAPAWSPDGKKIAFMSDRANKNEFDIYMMNAADGTGVERLTNKGTNWFPQFSFDGKRIALHVANDVHILDVATKRLQRLTFAPDNGMYPTWSRDGRLAFMSWRNGRTEIFTMTQAGTDQQRLVSLPSGGAIDPRWSPDGTRLVFVQVSEATPLETSSPTSSRIIYTVDLASGKVTRLSR